MESLWQEAEEGEGLGFYSESQNRWNGTSKQSILSLWRPLEAGIPGSGLGIQAGNLNALAFPGPGRGLAPLLLGLCGLALPSL